MDKLIASIILFTLFNCIYVAIKRRIDYGLAYIDGFTVISGVV